MLPGPLLNSLTSIPHDIACVQGTRHLYLERLHEKYGPIVRISPTEVSFIETSIWRDVWGFKRDKAECPKSDNQERLNGYTGILDADRMDHRRIRRLLSHAFSENTLRQQEHRVQHQVNLFIQGLSQNCVKGPVDMTQWIQWTTFDIMGDLAFGESFNSLQVMRTHPWQQFLLDHIAASVYTGIAQRWGLDRIARLCTPPTLMQAVREFYDLSSKKIEQRMTLGKDRGDFLDHILKYDLISNESKENGDLKGLRLEELKNTASDIAIAGSETTATVLSGLLFYLLMNPTVYEKVTKEVRTLDSDENITVTSTDKLVYFNAVLTEALRIFVPSPIPAARTIPAPGQAVGGHFMPGGTRVCASQYIAYRSTLHFARPKEFIPERWLPEPHRPDEFKGDNATGTFLRPL